MSNIKEIILVGSFHFELYPDVIQEKEDDVLELVDYLAKFQPIKILLEWEQSQNKQLNERFQSIEDDFQINEMEQIGFRLAKKLNHEEVFAINWEGHLTQEDMTCLFEAINNEYPVIQNILTTYRELVTNIDLNTKLMYSFQKLNEKRLVDELERLYLSFATVEINKDSIGMNVLKKWMERELTIFKNILQVESKTNDRMLLLIGGDHLWMLRKLFEGIGWKVINPFSESSYGSR
jgi:hypothetical protein